MKKFYSLLTAFLLAVAVSGQAQAMAGSSWSFQPVDDETVKELLANKEEIARLPEVSTANNPKWYYIQLIGEEDRADRMYTLIDDKHVYGRYRINSTDDAELGKQLWRFEKSGSRYVIINKLTGKRLSLEFDQEMNSGCAMLNSASTITFDLKRAGNYFQIIGSRAATGSPSGEIYLHQGNSGYDYAIITVGSYYGASINSMYRFVPFEEFRFTYSDDIETSWYNIVNCGEAYDGLAIKEEQNGVSSQLVLVDAVEEDYAAQWKAVRPAQGGVQWVNRQTGNAINTTSEPMGIFNLLQAKTLVADGDIWTATYLGDKQYSFSCIEDDRVERYMGANAENANAPEELDLKKILNSSHAWQLRLVETEPTAVNEVETDMPTVRVRNHRIYVDGCTDFKVYTASGVKMPADSRLQPGLYIVTVKDKSVKINIQ